MLQKLLQKGKVLYYFKKAINEIVMVVIGILIAVQINNWNEKRKEKIQEIGHLKNIQEDILLDLNDVIWNTNFHNESLNSKKELLYYMMSTENKPNKTISYEIALGSPILLTLHDASFTNVKNNNLNIIRNKKLKKMISNYYDNFSKTILAVENNMTEYKSYSTLKPYFIKHFQYEKTEIILDSNTSNDVYFSPEIARNKLILSDTISLKNNNEFKIILAESIRLNILKISFYKDFLSRINELKAAINEELKIIENN